MLLLNNLSIKVFFFDGVKQAFDMLLNHVALDDVWDAVQNTIKSDSITLSRIVKEGRVWITPFNYFFNACNKRYYVSLQKEVLQNLEK